MFRVSPDVSLPNDLAELLFETSPTEDTWYEEKERIEALINDWLVLNAYEEGSATDAETDSDVERI